MRGRNSGSFSAGREKMPHPGRSDFSNRPPAGTHPGNHTGGSLVIADPSAEIPVVVCALGGKMKVVGPSGERTLAADEFFLTYLTSALEGPGGDSG